MTARTWSEQQNAIFRFFLEALGHLIVRARAGCGKTTTIVEAVIRYIRAFPGKRVVVCAFNTRIKDELVLKFAGVMGVEVKTAHAIGFAVVRRFWTGVRVNDAKKDPVIRAQHLTERVCGSKVPDAIKKLVTRLHTLGRETVPHANHASDLIDLAYAFDCEPDEEWQDDYPVEKIAGYAVEAMRLAAAEKPTCGIDFADMIFLPIRNGWLRKWADMVVIDEGQDWTVAQLEIARGICRGRIMVVGDNRQAIYGFRGADSGSLDRLKSELGAEELGLTVTYRCGKKIVDAAAKMVPDFTAGPNNPEGEILGIRENQLAEAAAEGDFILSRKNAPLVAIAMKTLRAGKRTKIAGRDIGNSLTGLVKKLAKSARSVPEFLERLASWERKQIARAEAQGKTPEAIEKKIEEILDQSDMLKNLAEDASSVKDIEARIEALFTDNGLGAAGVITCSSVHKAKGLEAERVFVLAETFRDDTMEEQNICYVAVTRAKQTLVMVGSVACASLPTGRILQEVA